MRKRKIAVMTTGRQDWGILRSVVKELDDSPEFSISVIAGGMACDKAFGNIADHFVKDGIPLYEQLQWEINSEGGISVCEEIAHAVVLVEKCLKGLAPEAVMLLGDRFETLAIAQVATLLKIPLIHLHGGEETTGAIDNQIRHAISKLSHIHFASHADHARRLIQMGEIPENVHVVGAPGLDNINRDDLPDICEILQDLKLRKNEEEPLFLITYHPPTLLGDASSEIEALLAALSEVEGVCIFTIPNSDSGNLPIRNAIQDFVDASPEKRVLVKALGEKRYWTVLKSADVVLGNSSSGIIEAPAVPVPVINIGQRQKGRGMAPCVINLPTPTAANIRQALQTCLTPTFKQSISNTDSLFGNGKSASKIYEILKTVDFDSVRIKSFYSIPQ